MRVWFWGWLVTAVALTAVSALARDRHTAPFAAGAWVATAAEALRASPTVEWIAFLAVSSLVYVAVNRRRYLPRHRRGGRDG